MAGQRRPRPDPETDAEEYAERLLNDIRLMLAYVNENGIALPEDLRSKIAMLLRNEMRNEDGPATMAPPSPMPAQPTPYPPPSSGETRA